MLLAPGIVFFQTVSERHGGAGVFIPQLYSVSPSCAYPLLALLVSLVFAPRDISFFGKFTLSNFYYRPPQAQPSTSECLPAAPLAACRIPEETATFLSRLRYGVSPCVSGLSLGG